MSGSESTWMGLTCDWSVAGECVSQTFQIVDGRAFAVPTVVVVLLFFVVAFFVYSSAYLLFCHVRFRSRMRLLTRAVGAQRSTPARIDPEKLNAVGEALSNDALTEHGWSEFKETLVAEGDGPTTQIYNTRQAVEFFGEGHMVDANMHPAFFRAVPGVLTSLGLLGTFLAILLGLAVIQIPPAGAESMQIEGIDSFVNALSGKFLSSVAALFLAIVFTLAETRVLHRADSAYRDFCQTFDAVFPRRTAEEVLTAMNIELQGQRQAFEHFNTDLSARFKEGVSEGLGPVLERIVEGLNSLTADRDSNIEALMERLTTEFRQAMSQSAGIEFEQIASAMNQATDLIQRANEQSSESRESIQQLVRAVDDARSRQVEAADQQSRSLNALLERMVETMGESSEASRSAVNSTIQEMLERVATESRENAARLDGTLARYNERMTLQVDDLCQRVEAAAAIMESAGTAGSAELREAIAQVTTRLDASSQSLVTQTESSNSRLLAELSRVLEQNRSVETDLAQIQASMETSLQAWNSSAERIETMTAPLRAASESVAEAGDKIRAVSREIGEVQQRTSELSLKTREDLSRLGDMERASAQLLEQHQRVFETVQSSLSGVLDALAEKLETVQSVTARGLEQQLREFDNHLGTATQKLGSAVDELGEVLDQAADRILGGVNR